MTEPLARFLGAQHEVPLLEVAIYASRRGQRGRAYAESRSARVAPGGYLPFIVVTRSPAFCQLLLHAGSTSNVLRHLLDLADQHFGKVQDKLPLQASLLVVIRRFPLYALLEAGQMVLDHGSFSKELLQHPWWDATAHAQNPFFGSYSTKPSSDGKWALTDLAPVGQAGQF